MNRVNLVPPASKAAKGKIARDRNVNANSASAKNKVVDSKAAASKADDKTGYPWVRERREVTPAVSFFTSRRPHDTCVRGESNLVMVAQETGGVNQRDL